MNKFVRWTQNYLLFALPFVLICMAWSSLKSEKEIIAGASFLVSAAWEVLSWNLMLWFVALIVFLVVMVAVPSVREKTLVRLANLKERDEREEFITGKASRTAYVSSLSVLIFLLFFSIFSVNISHRPEAERAIDGKTKTLAIGLGFSLLDKPRTEVSQDKVIFESQDIPLSKTGIILIVLLWQLAAFSIAARRENLRDV